MEGLVFSRRQGSTLVNLRIPTFCKRASNFSSSLACMEKILNLLFNNMPLS